MVEPTTSERAEWKNVGKYEILTNVTKKNSPYLVDVDSAMGGIAAEQNLGALWPRSQPTWPARLRRRRAYTPSPTSTITTDQTTENTENFREDGEIS